MRKNFFERDVNTVQIAEVSEKYDISPETIRYYERIGLIPRVNRNQSGIRDFTEKDCGWVEFIKCLRNAGLPIELLIEYVSLFQQGDDETMLTRKAILVEQRGILKNKIDELTATLERLDYKIGIFEQRIVAHEKTLK